SGMTRTNHSIGAGRSDFAPDAPEGGRGYAIWLLGVAVVITCAGMTAATWRGDGTSINSFLFLELGWSHEAAGRYERLAMVIVLMLSVCGMIRPRWVLLLPVAVYGFLEALAGWHQGGYPFSEWTPAARAPAYLAPVVLVLLYEARGRSDPAGQWRRVIAEWLMRVAMASVFLVHGLEAFRLHPRFVDLILSSSWSLTGLRWSEADAATLLRVIGVLDIALAISLVIRPWRVVLAWMAFWAGLAAASRMTAHGWGAYPEFLVRATYVMVPLALWAMVYGTPRWRGGGSRQPSAPGEAGDQVSRRERGRVGV
ncbi:MAG TPA: hypothetical protein VMS21_13700, partial [Methylomirabilota bacterium]|nr:hypothetical protein [Methylomirabilota bacterium]